MYKLLLLSLLALSLTACEAETKDTSSDFNLVDGLQDCKMYTLDGKGGQRVYALRCPNSSTTTHWQEGGKNKRDLSTTVEEL